MDISDNYCDSTGQPTAQQSQQQQQQQQHVQTQQQNLMQGQQMQCDTITATDCPTTNVESNGPLGGPISLPAPPQNYDKAKTVTDIDLDSILLHQFSCLGTRDHEDLVEQFHNLMNNQMNKDGARFFLEMSNWNVQTAIGCYLDFYNGQNSLSMKIIAKYQPNSQQMLWRLQNTGLESWPRGCYLVSTSQTRRIEVPTVKPGDTCEVIADVSSNEPVVWRLCAPHGEYFGENLCLVPPGSYSSHEELNERLAQLAVTEQNTAQCSQVNIGISERME